MQKCEGFSVCNALPVPPGTDEAMKKRTFSPTLGLWRKRCECAKKPEEGDRFADPVLALMKFRVAVRLL